MVKMEDRWMVYGSSGRRMEMVEDGWICIKVVEDG